MSHRCLCVRSALNTPVDCIQVLTKHSERVNTVRQEHFLLEFRELYFITEQNNSLNHCFGGHFFCS